MPKYRKRPIIVEAIQWFPGMNIPYVLERGVKLPENERIGEVYDFLHELTIDAKPGDWVMTGVRGEHYVVKDGVFQETYQKVVEEQTPLEKAELAYLDQVRITELNRKICELGVCIHDEHQTGMLLEEPPQTYLEFLRHT